MNKAKQMSLLLFKVFSALCFSYVLTLIGQELLSYGLFSFVFLLISISLAFFYFVKGYNIFGVLALDIFLVLIAFLLRFYVVMAYGS